MTTNKFTAGLVSTIIPVFNRADLVVDAIESVLQQHYRPIEIIVVNDGSTDETLAVLSALSQQHAELTVISQINQGPSVARETGRLNASGEYIQYLDSDDLLLPDKFSLQVAALEQESSTGVQAGLCYSKEMRIGLDDLTLLLGDDLNLQQLDLNDESAIKITGQRIEAIFPALLWGSLWGTSVPLWRRSLTDQLGEWLSLINEEDIEYDARAGALGVSLAYVEQFVAIQRVHHNHLSQGGDVDPVKLRHRFKSRQHVYKHAINAGMNAQDPAMQHFAKTVFLLARHCVEQNMLKHSLKALSLAIKANGGKYCKASLYRVLLHLFGTKNLQKLNRFGEWLRQTD